MLVALLHSWLCWLCVFICCHVNGWIFEGEISTRFPSNKLNYIDRIKTVNGEEGNFSLPGIAVESDRLG